MSNLSLLSFFVPPETCNLTRSDINRPLSLPLLFLPSRILAGRDIILSASSSSSFLLFFFNLVLLDPLFFLPVLLQLSLCFVLPPLIPVLLFLFLFLLLLSSFLLLVFSLLFSIFRIPALKLACGYAYQPCTTHEISPTLPNFLVKLPLFPLPLPLPVPLFVFYLVSYFSPSLSYSFLFPNLLPPTLLFSSPASLSQYSHFPDHPVVLFVQRWSILAEEFFQRLPDCDLMEVPCSSSQQPSYPSSSSIYHLKGVTYEVKCNDYPEKHDGNFLFCIFLFCSLFLLFFHYSLTSIHSSLPHPCFFFLFLSSSFLFSSVDSGDKGRVSQVSGSQKPRKSQPTLSTSVSCSLLVK
jgi:hypothetical protein